MVIWLIVSLLLSACQGTKEHQDKTQLTISAAASMTDSLMELKKEFEQKNTNVELVYNFGGSGSLRRQIEQGAPIDLFFSASESDYEQLLNSGFVEKGEFAFTNELVIIKASHIDATSFEEWIHTNNNGKIAIGTPKVVPAGSYAQETLEYLNQWESLYEQYVFAKDVTHIKKLVKEGLVDIGFVYRSDTNTDSTIHVLETVQTNMHAPINYYVAILKNTEHFKEAKLFLDYLLSQEALSIFEAYGFNTGDSK